ncbi:FtsK/SpoIIIE domain-containing protein [Microbacterium sp.]|uniref:FtsK/SpoIIIE domain-containing protein n=1 Tax=Microbacterium sp. TaxID=51671 RepID=UPI00281203A1|nr:FtsK/SpoIIIE domain-containing protein [Microbacterium sp.]
MDATTIVLPSPPAEPRRPPLPLLAAIVPVIAGVVLWLITGSLFALCFAALGPLMLMASFLDGMRVRRRERRTGLAEATESWTRAEVELERLHRQEHESIWRANPDAAGCLAEPPLRGHLDPDRNTLIVLGRGERPSRVGVSGAEDERSRAFRERAARLRDAPITVAIGGGVCIRATEPVAAAVARALTTQLCLRFAPGRLTLVGDRIDAWGLERFPHARRRRGAFRIAIGDSDEAADAFICVRRPGEEPPDGVTTVLDLLAPARARLRTPEGVCELSAEAMSEQQARTIAVHSADRAAAGDAVPARVALDELPQAGRRGLSAVFCHGEREPMAIDLVDDGPHAVVTGMTGTGKSELLISWVVGMAAAHSPDDVAFVLIDFKGGTAFEPLRRLPHVAAVITDLDAEGARRGVGSLTAELRRREAELAAAGARDVSECQGLARLVIVVDEFAALLQEHPDLAAVFTDVAARGRALGMHLVLGTQRASGVIREALSANCPLRISLRVADTADSRLVIGSADAAELPGGEESLGMAFVRRQRDMKAHAVRVALTAPAMLDSVARKWSFSDAPRSPWLPPLPTQLALPDSEALRAGRATPDLHAATATAVLLGIADEPELQRQPWVELPAGSGLAIVGGPSSGKSTAIALAAEQRPDAVVVPADLETAWDAVAELSAGRHGIVLCDDLDLLASQYPPEYAQLFLQRWESIVRAPAGAIVTVSRVTGPIARLLDALPHRAVLRLSSKVEHVAAGGDVDAFRRDRPAGRAWMDGREVQICQPSDVQEASDENTVHLEAWTPRRALAGVVTLSAAATRAELAARHRTHEVLDLSASVESASSSAARRILVGDPEQWRGQWAVLQEVRSAGELLVTAECAPELRQLAGVRELPPYARTHAGRAWVSGQGRPPRRVRLA